jgi:hypothetical protein
MNRIQVDDSEEESEETDSDEDKILEGDEPAVILRKEMQAKLSYAE